MGYWINSKREERNNLRWKDYFANKAHHYGYLCKGMIAMFNNVPLMNRFKHCANACKGMANEIQSPVFLLTYNDNDEIINVREYKPVKVA